MSPSKQARMPLVLLGAGGHAKVLFSLIKAAGRELLGVCDPGLAKAGASHWRGVPVLGGDDALKTLDPSTVGLVNGIGQLVGSGLRQRVYEEACADGFTFPVLIHPAAWVDDSVELGQGVQVMAGAIVQPDVRIGVNSVINTRASLDHDCVIAAHVHIAPGAVLCGGVVVAQGAFIGSGATLIQGVVICARSVVGAGTVVVREVPPDSIVKGLSVRPVPLTDS
ncbi:acetyltransferase [Pseudomonas sp. 1121_17]